jgi:hypothetical protein
MGTMAEKIEDLDYRIAAHQRSNSAQFKSLCAMSLEWMSKHVDQDVLREQVQLQVFPAKEVRRSPSFTRGKVKESNQ